MKVTHRAAIHSSTGSPQRNLMAQKKDLPSGKETRIRSGAPKKRLTCGTKKERLGILSFPIRSLVRQVIPLPI